MDSNIIEYTFHYPSRKFLTKLAYKLEDIDFYPIIHSHKLAQANCALKSLFLYREGAKFKHQPGLDYRYTARNGERQAFPYGYHLCAETFERVIQEILSNIHLDEYSNLIHSNPSRSVEWREIVEELASQKLEIVPEVLIEDILSVFMNKYRNNGFNKYKRYSEYIKFKFRIFNPHCRLPIDPSLTTDGRFSFKGEFPILGTISEIDFKNNIITDYFYHRDEYLFDKPEYMQGHPVEDSESRRELMIYLPRVTNLWILNQAIITLNSTCKRYRYYNKMQRKGNEILLNNSKLRDSISQLENFNLHLVTPNEEKIVTNYSIDEEKINFTSLVTNGLIYFCQAINAQLNMRTGLWSHERPCEALKDPHCNFYYPCKVKRGHIIPNSTKLGVRPWLSALLQEIIIYDTKLYKIAEFLPNMLLTYSNSEKFCKSRFIRSLNDTDGEKTFEIQLVDSDVALFEPYLIPDWTIFFGQLFKGRIIDIQENIAILKLEDHPSIDSFNFETGQPVFLFPSDKWKDGLRWQQQALFNVITHNEPVTGRSTSEEIENASRSRLRRGRDRLSDAAYGDDVNLI